MSSAYLPPIEYFAYLMQYEAAFIEQNETYPKQTYRNRSEIFTEKGKTTLSVPVSKVFGNHTRTSQIKINNEENWKIKHWRAIKAAYLSSPYFLYYKDELQAFYYQKHDTLLEFNTALTRTLCNSIGISIELLLTDTFTLNPENTADLRLSIHPKKPPTIPNFPNYIQVFNDRHVFIPNLSIIDLIFNLGPETKNYLGNLLK